MRLSWCMQVVLFLAFRILTPLPTSTANVVPAPDSRVPLRPPGAFAKRKDLTAKVRSSSCLHCSFAALPSWWTTNTGPMLLLLGVVKMLHLTTVVLVSFLILRKVRLTMRYTSHLALCCNAALTTESLLHVCMVNRRATSWRWSTWRRRRCCWAARAWA